MLSMIIDKFVDMSEEIALVRFFETSVSFGQKKVFENLSLQINAGEKVCLTGTSGIGKTTFLNLILGFIYPSKGRVEVMGKVLNPANIRWVRSQTAWVPQDIMVAAETAREFLLLPFHFKQNRGKMPEQRAITIMLEKLGLEPEILSQSLASLSGGQKQRMAMASALLLDKPLLLIDEPTSALDHASAALMAAVVNERVDQTLISVSHDDIWANAMHRIIPLDNSRFTS